MDAPIPAGDHPVGASPSCEKLFIFFVEPSPEPDDLVWRSPHTHCAVTPADADGNQPIRSMNLLEAQTWVTRVLHELAIRGAGLTPNISRQCGQQLPKVPGDVRIHNWSGSSGVVRPWSCSSRARSAIRSRALPDLPNSSSHGRSVSICSSNQAPIASCSLSGSFDASKIAFSSSLPIAIQFSTRSNPGRSSAAPKFRTPDVAPQFHPGGENGLSHSFRWRELRRLTANSTTSGVLGLDPAGRSACATKMGSSQIPRRQEFVSDSFRPIDSA